MISLPKKPKVVEKEDNKATFEISELYPGYGVTVGNALRRVLLSSLEGAAVTQVKIDGASHEFSTISGVVEDVINIVLNLKRLNFKMFSDEPQKATLSVKGKKEVKGSDFDIPTQLELVNKDAHVATLTNKKSSLEMEIKVKKGTGYQLKDKKKEENLEVGVILIDAIYSPIKKVSFRSEDMRVGERTDFDRLFLDIETDGTITPEDALDKASTILLKHFELIHDEFGEEIEEEEETEEKEEEQEEEEEEEQEEEKKKTKKEAKKTKIVDLDLPTKTTNLLRDNNIKTVAGLLRRKRESLLDIDGMGPARLEKVEKELDSLGVSLKEEEE